MPAYQHQKGLTPRGGEDTEEFHFEVAEGRETGPPREAARYGPACSAAPQRNYNVSVGSPPPKVEITSGSCCPACSLSRCLTQKKDACLLEQPRESLSSLFRSQKAATRFPKTTGTP